MSHSAHKAVRRFCLDCQGGHVPSVRDCTDALCVLHTLRHGPAVEPEGALAAEANPDAEETAAESAKVITKENTGPVRRIRHICLGCAGSRQEVRACDAKENCALWSFRFGVLPATFKRVVGRRRRWRESLPLPGLLL